MIFFAVGVVFVADGVVVPALDDDLGEEDEGDGIEGDVSALLSLQLPVVVQIAAGFHFLELLL